MNKSAHGVNVLGYKKPICACGGDVVISEGHSVEEIYEVTKTGKQSKKMLRREYAEKDFKVLRCKECTNRYWYDKDENGRIILGEPCD